MLFRLLISHGGVTHLVMHKAVTYDKFPIIVGKDEFARPMQPSFCGILKCLVPFIWNDSYHFIQSTNTIVICFVVHICVEEWRVFPVLEILLL